MYDLLKQVVQDLINDRTEQAEVALHEYIVGKTQQVAGLAEASLTEGIGRKPSAGKSADKFTAADWQHFFKTVDRLSKHELSDVDYVADRIEIAVGNEGGEITKAAALSMAKKIGLTEAKSTHKDGDLVKPHDYSAKDHLQGQGQDLASVEG